MRKLHPGGLSQGQVQFALEMLVHDVDHSVAESPKQEQGTDEGKGNHYIRPVRQDEHAFLRIVHFFHRSFRRVGRRAD